jgi:hypothetical protein
MANIKAGEIAKREYSKVWYFPFDSMPAAPYVLTSNPFAFLSAWLDSEVFKIKKATPHRKRLEKAKYFCQLAEDFNAAAHDARMPAKATPLYYVHLNLVKCYLLIGGLDLEKAFEHHGLTLPFDYEDRLKIGRKPDEGISIFKEFAIKTGLNFDEIAGSDITLEEILLELPEIHEMGFAFNFFTGKRKLLPLQIEIRVNEGRNKLFYELIYEKKNEKFMGANKLEETAKYTAAIKRIEDQDQGNIRFRSHRAVRLDHRKEISWRNSYRKICKEITALGVTSLLTRDGYRFYLNLNQGKLNRYSSQLALMFYIGSVARYRPSLNESILKGEYQVLINEAIETCPSQFYYHLVSLMTNRVCAIPMAKIL